MLTSPFTSSYDERRAYVEALRVLDWLRYTTEPYKHADHLEATAKLIAESLAKQFGKSCQAV